MLNLFSVTVPHSWLSWKDSQVPAQGQLSDPLNGCQALIAWPHHVGDEYKIHVPCMRSVKRNCEPLVLFGNCKMPSLCSLKCLGVRSLIIHIVITVTGILACLANYSLIILKIRKEKVPNKCNLCPKKTLLTYLLWLWIFIHQSVKA